MKKKALVIACFCIIIALMVVNSKLYVQATGYNIVVKVSSPTQNETYITNDVPLSFSCDANIAGSPNIANYSVVFAYNVDGQPIFDVFGNPIFTGENTRIGQFYQPVPLDYNSSIHVSNGSHSLFVLATYWITPAEEYADTFKVNNVSQVVNFTVNADLPTSPSPLPSEEPQPTEHDITTGALFAVTSIAIFLCFLFYFIRRK